MKICYITDLYPPYDVGGAERVVEIEAKSMAQMGNEVVVITTNPYVNKASIFPKYYYNGDIKIWSFYPIAPYFLPNYKSTFSVGRKMLGFILSLYNPHAAIVIKKILKKEKPDIVHSHYIQNLSYGALRGIKGVGSGWVHTFHGYQFKCPRGALCRSSGDMCNGSFLPCKYYEKLFKKIISMPDIIIAISTFIKKNLIMSGYDPNKIKFVPNGFTIPNLSEIEFNKYILFVGRLVEIKGVEILLKAFAKLRRKDFILKIVGEGESKHYFINKAKKYGARVEFTGRISTIELNSLYRKSYLAVVPSLWHEPLPTVVIEAMAYGKPVIASNVGGIPDMVDHGKTGYLFQPGNISDLSRYLDELINDEELAYKMGKEGREKVINEFSQKKHTETLMHIYEEIL